MATYPGTLKPSRTGTGAALGGTANRTPARAPLPPASPYGDLPALQPIDDSWYEREMQRLNELARQSAQQQAAYQAQSAQQYQDFANTYMQRQNQMMPQGRARVSKMFMLGGY
jgi:hypothetical protein